MTRIARDPAVHQRSRRRKQKGLRPTWKNSKDSWSITWPRAETGPYGRLDCAASCGAGKERRLLRNSRFCMGLFLPVAETPPELACSRQRRRAGIPAACGVGGGWWPAGRRRSPGRRNMDTALRAPVDLQLPTAWQNACQRTVRWGAKGRYQREQRDTKPRGDFLLERVFQSHVCLLVQKCSGLLLSLNHAKHVLLRATIKHLIAALVFPTVRYCMSVFGICGQTGKRRMQKVINFAAHVLSGRSIYDHIADVLCDARWLTAEQVVTNHRS